MDGVNSISSASANDKSDAKEKSKMVMVLAATNRPFDIEDRKSVV